MKKLLVGALIGIGLCIAQQGTTPRPEQIPADASQVKGVYGTIKEVKSGDKIVIKVENGKDRAYRLSDPKRRVSVAEGLAIGDKVKIIESGDKADKSVQVVRDVRNDGGQSGQRTRTGNEQK